MSEHAQGPGGHVAHVASPISVPWVIAASVIGGLGVLAIWMWISEIPTSAAWMWSFGPFLVLISILMFLNDRAGLDHA